MEVGSLQGESCFCGKASRGDTPHQDPATPALVFLDPKMQLSREGFVVTDQAGGIEGDILHLQSKHNTKGQVSTGSSHVAIPRHDTGAPLLPTITNPPHPPQQVVNLSWSVVTRRWTHTGNHRCHRLQRRKGPSLGLVFSRFTTDHSCSIPIGEEPLLPGPRDTAGLSRQSHAADSRYLWSPLAPLRPTPPTLILQHYFTLMKWKLFTLVYIW